MASTRKKKNKYLPLLIMLAALLVLFVGYKLISKANDRKAAAEAAEEAAANATIMVADYDYTTITDITYEKAGHDRLSFVVKGTAWEYLADSHFPLNSEKITAMAGAIASIGAGRRVDEGSPSDYGLDSPEYEIVVKYSDGSAHTYRIGDYNSFASGYYFSADGEMYIIPSGLTSYFDYDLDDLLVLDTLPSSDWTETGYIQSVTVSLDGVTSEITGADEIETVIANVKKLYLNDCADWYATDDEKAACGIDGDDYVSVKYKKPVTTTDADGNESTNYLDTTFRINFGSKDGNGYVLGCPEKSNIIYRFQEDTVNGLR